MRARTLFLTAFTLLTVALPAIVVAMTPATGPAGTAPVRLADGYDWH